MTKIIIVTNTPQPWKQIKKECRETELLFYLLSPEEAEKELEKGKFQMVVLDLDEIIILIKLMKEHELTQEIPILWVLPRSKVHLFKPEQKISDLIFSPIDPEEFLCRIRRLLWQTQGIDSNQTIRVDELTLDLSRYEVKLNGELVSLTYKEYELLKFLAGNRGKVFTRETLLNRVWGYDYFGGTRTVDVHIRRLRSKIEDINHMYIETVRNIGYRFKA